jgi:hypothetical protein
MNGAPGNRHIDFLHSKFFVRRLGDDMKLRDEDKNWLTEEIKKVVTDSIRDSVDKFRPHGWRRVSIFIREWGIAGTILTVFVALLALAATAFYEATARIEKQARFEEQTTSKLNNMSTDIQSIQGELARMSLFNHAALPLTDFKSTLPDLSSAIATVREQKLVVSPNVMADIQKKLVATDDNSPGYWQAASQLITYRSMPAGTKPSNDRPCRDMNVVIDRERGVDGVYEHIEMSNCTFDLDNNPGFAWNGLPGYEYLVLHNVRVRYRGGAIHDIGRVMFDRCTFEFQISAPPPIPAQHLTETLLAASDISKVSFGLPATHS